MWSSASARACTGRFFDTSNVLAAVATASSTSSAVGTPISATTASSYGLWTSNVPSPVRHSPFTRNGRTVIASSLPSVHFCRPLARSVEGPHHVLDLRVVLQRVHRHVLAVPALLVAAVRHLGGDHEVRVHPHGPVLEASSHPHRAARVARPHGRREPVDDVVRPVDGLVLVAEPLHGDDRAEHLLLHDLGVLGYVGHDRGLVVEAGAVHLLATGEDLAPGVLCAVDETGHALALAVRDERSHLDLLVVQVTDLDGLDGRHELGQEVLIDPRAGD